MKRYTFDHRLGVMRECPTGEWVMHDEAKRAVRRSSASAPARFVNQYDRSRELPVKFIALDPQPPGDGVDIDRVHRRAAAVVEA